MGPALQPIVPRMRLAFPLGLSVCLSSYIPHLIAASVTSTSSHAPRNLPSFLPAQNPGFAKGVVMVMVMVMMKVVQ